MHAFCSRKFAETSQHLRGAPAIIFSAFEQGERERWRQAAEGWVGSFICAVGDPTLSSLRGLRGAGTWQKEPGTKEQRTRHVCMQLITHCPGGSCLSVAGRWLGCVLEQSTALRLRWCEAVVVMGMPRDVCVWWPLAFAFSFRHIWCLLFAFVCGQW